MLPCVRISVRCFWRDTGKHVARNHVCLLGATQDVVQNLQLANICAKSYCDYSSGTARFPRPLMHAFSKASDAQHCQSNDDWSTSHTLVNQACWQSFVHVRCTCPAVLLACGRDEVHGTPSKPPYMLLLQQIVRVLLDFRICGFWFELELLVLVCVITIVWVPSVLFT